MTKSTTIKAVAAMAVASVAVGLAPAHAADLLPVPEDNCFDVDYDFTQGTTLPADWSVIWGAQNVQMTGTSDGLKLTLFSDAVTLANNRLQMQYGSMSVVMRSANVPGVVSDAMLISPNKDEIDVEFVGKDTTNMQSNFFYRGIPSYGVYGEYHPVGNVDSVFHNYTVNWTPDAIEWLVDGNLVRTWTKAGAYSSVYQQVMFPTETSQIHLGVWAHSGDWSGGPTDWSQYPNGAPMYVRSVGVRCYQQHGDSSTSTSAVASTSTVTSSAAPTTSTVTSSAAPTTSTVSSSAAAPSSSSSVLTTITSSAASSPATGTSVTYTTLPTLPVQSTSTSVTLSTYNPGTPTGADSTSTSCTPTYTETASAAPTMITTTRAYPRCTRKVKTITVLATSPTASPTPTGTSSLALDGTPMSAVNVSSTDTIIGSDLLGASPSNNAIGSSVTVATSLAAAFFGAALVLVM